MLDGVYFTKDECRGALLLELNDTEGMRRPELNALLQLFFTKGRHTAGSFTLDDFEPVPEGFIEEVQPRFGVAGKIISLWELTKSRSPDGAACKILNLLPCKCFVGPMGELVLYQEFLPRYKVSSAHLPQSAFHRAQ